MPDRKVNLRVARSNVLAEASHNLTLVQHRLYLLAVSLVQREDEVLPDISIHVRDFKRVFGYRAGNNGVGLQLQEATKGLEGASIRLGARTDQPTRVPLVEHARFVSGNVANDGLARIDLRFHSALEEHLLHLENRFCVLRVQDLAGLSSRHALRLAELVKAWSGGRPHVERRVRLGELAEAFAVPYSDWATLKKRVLAPASGQLETAAMALVTYSAIRRHRSTEEVQLTIRPLNPPRLATKTTHRDGAAASLARRYGTAESSLLQLDRLSEQDAYAVVTRAIASIEKMAGGPNAITNPGAYIATAIKNEITRQEQATSRPEASPIPLAEPQSGTVSPNEDASSVELASRLVEDFERDRGYLADQLYRSFPPDKARLIDAQASAALSRLRVGNLIPAGRKSSMLRGYRHAAMEHQGLIDYSGALSSIEEYARSRTDLAADQVAKRWRAAVSLAMDMWQQGAAVTGASVSDGIALPQRGPCRNRREVGAPDEANHEGRP